jgi:predicted DNA-binding transcriptional regulator AlpA
MPEAPERYLGWREVQPLFGGISRTTAWRGVRDGWLPRPVQVSPGRHAWKSSDVTAWQNRLTHRRGPDTEAGHNAPAP